MKVSFANLTVSHYNVSFLGLMWSARLTCPTGHTSTWEASARVNGDGRSTPVLNLLVSVWILLNGSLFGPTQVDGIQFMYPGKVFYFHVRPSSSLSALASCLSPLTIGPCPTSSILWYGSSGSYTRVRSFRSVW